MDEILKQILAKLETLEEGQDALQTELKSFRDSQEVSIKLLTGDSAGIKTQLRDMRDDLKEWRRSTDRKIERLEDRLDGVRDALDH